MTVALNNGLYPFKIALLAVLSTPFTHMLSFTEIRTPNNLPFALPCSTCCCNSFALSTASAHAVTYLYSLLIFSVSSIAFSVCSTRFIFPDSASCTNFVIIELLAL